MSVGLIEFIYFVDGIGLIVGGYIAGKSKTPGATQMLLVGIGLIAFDGYNVITQPETMYYSPYLLVLPLIPLLILGKRWYDKKHNPSDDVSRNTVLMDLFDSLRLWHIAAGLLVIGFLVFVAFGSRLSEHSTCRQFESASAEAQNKTLTAMMKAHYDSGFGVSSLSLGFYCRMYPNRPINGIYSGN